MWDQGIHKSILNIKRIRFENIRSHSNEHTDIAVKAKNTFEQQICKIIELDALQLSELPLWQLKRSGSKRNTKHILKGMPNWI